MSSSKTADQSTDSTANPSPDNFINVENITIGDRKTILAGSRDAVDDHSEDGLQILISSAFEEAPFSPGVIVSGTAKGVDQAGETWAKQRDLPIAQFPANWNDLSCPDRYIKENQYGKYNSRAGHERNRKMAQYADSLLFIWDGESPGTYSMIKLALEHIDADNIHGVVYGDIDTDKFDVEKIAPTLPE